MNDIEIPNSIEQEIQNLAAEILVQIESKNPEEFVKMFLLCVNNEFLKSNLKLIAEKGIKYADKGVLWHLEKILLGDFFD